MFVNAGVSEFRGTRLFAGTGLVEPIGVEGFVSVGKEKQIPHEA